MKYFSFLLVIFTLSCSAQESSSTEAKPRKEPSSNEQNMKDQTNWNKLTPEEEKVIVHKGTEYPFTGKFNEFKKEGIFLCKRCNTPLFKSEDKFNSGSGWPSFDDMIPGAVKEVPDADGRRIEIVCGNCEGHLGHVFKGEGFTSKNTRHCVNSVSLSFQPDEIKNADSATTQVAYFASGCFWGTEYYLQQLEGVLDTEVGYIGGTVINPSYKEVCTGRTGHAEAVKVTYDPQRVSYEKLAKFFFETHDPTQVNRQGPDIGTQYRSEIFYVSEEQKRIAEKLIQQLEQKGLKVATKVTAASPFYSGEGYHQDYYQNNGKTPYCHKYTQRF